jgi:dynein heavy chain 1
MADTELPETQQPAEQGTQVVIEVSAFANYLRRVLPVLLEDGDDTPKSLVTALKEMQLLDCMKKFLSDSQVPVLYVQRNINKGKY